MKKILFTVIILFNGLFVYGQTQVIDVYELPIKPKTKEWQQFETIKKRIDALQIPDNNDLYNKLMNTVYYT